MQQECNKDFLLHWYTQATDWFSCIIARPTHCISRLDVTRYGAYLCHLLWAATWRALFASALMCLLRWSCLSNFFPHTPQIRRHIFLCCSLSCFVLKVSSHQGRVHTSRPSRSLCFLCICCSK